MISIVEAVYLGIVEGLTEFLPVSSTGHLILTDHLFFGGAEVDGLEKQARDSFHIVIQFGALLAVMVYFRTLLWKTFQGLFTRDEKAWRLTVCLGIAFLPAAFLGLAIHGWIKQNLFGVGPVIFALAAGGVLMICVERWRASRGIVGLSGVENVTPKSALIIGLAQCFSLWPGTSRSMSTIVGGQVSGLSTATAAEFSFLLALPTLGAACVYDFYKNREATLAFAEGTLALGVGLVVSAVVAWAVIAVFIPYLKKHGLIPFGVYRILLALSIWLWVA